MTRAQEGKHQEEQPENRLHTTNVLEEHAHCRPVIFNTHRRTHLFIAMGRSS